MSKNLSELLENAKIVASLIPGQTISVCSKSAQDHALWSTTFHRTYYNENRKKTAEYIELTIKEILEELSAENLDKNPFSQIHLDLISLLKMIKSSGIPSIQNTYNNDKYCSKCLDQIDNFLSKYESPQLIESKNYLSKESPSRELIKEIVNDVINEVASEVKGEVKGEVKNEVKGEVKNEVKGEVKNEVKEEVKNGIQNEIKGEMRNETPKIYEGEEKDTLNINPEEMIGKINIDEKINQKLKIDLIKSRIPTPYGSPIQKSKLRKRKEQRYDQKTHLFSEEHQIKDVKKNK
jgi:hypothetical protein